MTAWPPTRISSLELPSAHCVAVRARWRMYRRESIDSRNILFLWLLLSFCIFSGESFNPPCCVHELLLSGTERMACRADFEMDLRLRRTGLESLATSAFNDRINIPRMDICLHQASSQNNNYKRNHRKCEPRKS